MRLWTGKSKPWDNEYSKDLFNSYRYFIDAWFDGKWKGLGLSYSIEMERTDGTYSLGLDDKSIGLQWTLSLGHEVLQYDGFWHRFSLGPFFITWYSTHE